MSKRQKNILKETSKNPSFPQGTCFESIFRKKKFTLYLSLLLLLFNLLTQVTVKNKNSTVLPQMSESIMLIHRLFHIAYHFPRKKLMIKSEANPDFIVFNTHGKFPCRKKNSILHNRAMQSVWRVKLISQQRLHFECDWFIHCIFFIVSIQKNDCLIVIVVIFHDWIKSEFLFSHS